MEPGCEFYGIKVAKGKSATILADFDEDAYETIHLTQVALGDKPSKGPHTIFIEKEGEKFAIGTLDKDKVLHFSIDVTLATDDITVSHTGDSDVYVTGYRTVSMIAMDEDDFAHMYNAGDMDDSSDEESESDDDDKAPRLVAIKGGKANGKQQALVDDEAEETSSDDDDEEEEESEEESDEDRVMQALAGSDSDDSEDDEEESEEEEEVPVVKKGSEKRKQIAQTPQPAKKNKVDVQKAPATAPAKVAPGKGGSKEYSAALKAFLQQNGPSKLATLGSKVHRPDGLKTKLKNFLNDNKNVFKYDQNTDTVSLF